MTPRQAERAQKLIRQAAEQAGGQQALAERIGVARSHVSAWATGRYPVSAHALENIYRATGIAPRDLRPDLAELFRCETRETREHV